MLSPVISTPVINLSPMPTTTQKTAFLVMSSSFLYDSLKRSTTAPRFNGKVNLNST